MSFSEFLAYLNEFRGDKTQPAAFQTGDNFPNQCALHTIGLD
jgi:hypothetical protein